MDAADTSPEARGIPQRSREGKAMGPASLKALAHPFRIEILENLSRYGAQNSSSLAKILGESTGVTSYHLRQLAKYGFIHEVEGRGSTRERWWERSRGSVDLNTNGLSDTPGSDEAVRMVAREFEQRRADALMDFLENSWQAMEGEWKDAGVITTLNLRLTPKQLERLVARIQDQITNITSDIEEANEQDEARPVQIHFNAFPLIRSQPMKAGPRVSDH